LQTFHTEWTPRRLSDRGLTPAHQCNDTEMKIAICLLRFMNLTDAPTSRSAGADRGRALKCQLVLQNAQACSPNFAAINCHGQSSSNHQSETGLRTLLSYSLRLSTTSRISSTAPRQSIHCPEDSHKARRSIGSGWARRYSPRNHKMPREVFD